MELQQRRALNRTARDMLVKDNEVDNTDIEQEEEDVTTDTGDDTGDCFDSSDEEDFDLEYNPLDVQDMNMQV
jgi:hypothetical protein